MKMHPAPNPGELTPREKEILRPTLDAIDAGAPVLENDPDVVRLRELVVCIDNDVLHLTVITADGRAVEVYNRALLGPEPPVNELIPFAAVLDADAAQREMEQFSDALHGALVGRILGE